MTEYDSFIGKEVLVTETTRKFGTGDSAVEFAEYNLSSDDTVIAEIQAKWGSDKFRLFLPGAIGTCDYWMDRLNVHVEKNKDGKFTIKSISLG